MAKQSITMLLRLGPSPSCAVLDVIAVRPVGSLATRPMDVSPRAPVMGLVMVEWSVMPMTPWVLRACIPTMPRTMDATAAASSAGTALLRVLVVGRIVFISFSLRS
jgi:hypothetical protein